MCFNQWVFVSDKCLSAKYIEGLENRLGRMESLLRMSGLLTEEDAGKTDLGALEKRLAEKTSTRDNPAKRTESPAPPRSGAGSSMHESSPKTGSIRDSQDTPRESVTSPSIEGGEKSREEVENLSEAMCSLVTNNVGETRYIGRLRHLSTFRCYANGIQDHPLPSPYSPVKALNGSTRRQEILLFRKQSRTLSTRTTTNGNTGNLKSSGISSSVVSSNHSRPKTKLFRSSRTSSRTSIACSHCFTSRHLCTWWKNNIQKIHMKAVVGGPASMLHWL